MEGSIDGMLASIREFVSKQLQKVVFGDYETDLDN